MNCVVQVNKFRVASEGVASCELIICELRDNKQQAFLSASQQIAILSQCELKANKHMSCKYAK